MTLNDREKFILHLVALMTMQHFGKFKGDENLPNLVRRNRCRKLTTEDLSKIFDDQVCAFISTLSIPSTDLNNVPTSFLAMVIFSPPIEADTSTLSNTQTPLSNF